MKANVKVLGWMRTVYNLFILTLFSKPMLQRLQSESVQIRMFCVDIETIKCIHRTKLHLLSYKQFLLLTFQTERFLEASSYVNIMTKIWTRFFYSCKMDIICLEKFGNHKHCSKTWYVRQSGSVIISRFLFCYANISNQFICFSGRCLGGPFKVT